MTFRQELDWTVWLLRRARISCLEFYNCSVVNLVTVGYLFVTPGFKGFNGALLLCAPIWQWRLSGSLRCKHSCTYSNDTSNLQKSNLQKSSLCFKQSRRYTAVLHFLHLKLNWKFLQNWAISDKLSQTTSTVYIHSKPANKYLVYSKFQLQNFFEMQWFCLCYHSRISKYICFIRMQPEGSNTCVANFNNNLD